MNVGDAPDPKTPTHRYVYGSYVDEVIFREGDYTDSDSDNDRLLFYHRNQQYSIVALTDEEGEVVERYAYTAYGETTILDENGNEIDETKYSNPYTYTGRRADEELGLLYFRARYYDPQTGEFISRDPLGYVDGMSQYRAYFVPGGLDPSGTVSAGWHHPYPCHLGGAYSTQPLFYLDDAAHQAAHAYFRGIDIQFGDAGRELWKKFTEKEQILHVKNSMRAAGLSENIIESQLANILRGATPGTLTPRTGPKAPRIPLSRVMTAGIGLGVGIALDVLTSPAAIADDTVPHRFGDEDCKDKKACNCTEEVYVSAERNWSNPRLDIFATDWEAIRKGDHRSLIAIIANTESQRTGKILDCQNQPIKMTPSVCRSHNDQTTRKPVTWDPGDGFTYTKHYYLSCEPVEN